MAIAIRPRDDGVAFTLDGRSVDATTKGHQLELRGPRGTATFGPLRSGIVSSMAFVADSFGLPLGTDLRAVQRALEAGLARAAQARGRRDETLESMIAAVQPTPLVHSAGFLDASYLWQDAMRFRACRIAIARAEDDVIDDDTPAAAARLVESLCSWRELYSPRGAGADVGKKGKKALNSTLQQLGETMTADALWGLRRVPLSRMRTAPEVVEVLGWLGALHDVPPEVIALVESASDEAVRAVLDGSLDDRCGEYYEHTPVAVAALLAAGDPTSTTMLQLLRSAIEETSSAAGVRFVAPPVPLPREAGLRFIDDALGLWREGKDMHHCVYTRAWQCVDGDAFIFHASRDGAEGTIHVDANGRIVEYRGPFNRPSTAASWGAAVLRAWGAGFWVKDFDGAALAWRIARTPPQDARPLRSVAAIADAYRAFATNDEGRATALATWCRAMVPRAIDGELGLCVLGGVVPRLVAICADGAVLDSAAPPGTVVQRAPARAVARAIVDAPARVETTMSLPEAPIPFRRLGCVYVRSLEDLGRFGQLPRGNGPRQVPLERARAGEVSLVRTVIDRGRRFGEPDHEALLSVAHSDGVVDVIAVTPGILVAAAAPTRVALERWALGLWAPRIGMERSTWLGGFDAPPSAEPLRTVAACSLAYSLTCERMPDVDGKLAAFYDHHVRAAVQGHAFLCVRDRIAGSVVVLDVKRRVVARTDELLAR